MCVETKMKTENFGLQKPRNTFNFGKKLVVETDRG